jgi:hypothetical protein
MMGGGGGQMTAEQQKAMENMSPEQMKEQMDAMNKLLDRYTSHITSHISQRHCLLSYFCLCISLLWHTL